MNINESEFLLVESSIDPKEVAAKGVSFLFTHFPYDLHTFQYIKKDPTGKSTNLVRTYKDKRQAHKEALAHNKAGHDVYFMVNEGDGKVHPGKRIARSQQNVKQLSQCFIDTDNCPIDKVTAYLSTITTKPHAIIESSPKRFHLYFHLEPTVPTPENIQKWKAIQQILHRLGDPAIHSPSKTLGTDGTMHDYSKVLRVPGFIHTSKTFTVAVTEINEHPYYTLDELFTLTNAQSYIDYNISTYGTDTPTHVPSLQSDSIIEPGDRYAALQSLALSLANTANGHSTEQYATFTTFIRTRLDNSDEVYCTKAGKLTDKSLALFDSAIKKVQRENIAVIETAQTSLDKIHTNEEERSPWHLPDSFYLSAPNGFGDVVKQVMENSRYPCAALAFGTFLTGLSIIRAKTNLTPGGSSPALYTLNVAAAGYGKGDPMTLLQNMFWATGHGKLIGNEIRSDRGIYEHLSLNQGLALFLLDEVAPLLKAIQEDTASSHHANISKAILQLYSAGAMKGVSFGKVAKSTSKKGEPEIVIDNPMLALCAFTVPFEFDRLFNTDSIAKGLFQRFIPIVPEVSRIPKNDKADKHVVIKSELFTYALQAQELDDVGNPIAPLETVPRFKMTYTPEAARAFNGLEDSYRDKLILAIKDPELSHTSGLYSRLAEQIERVATVLAQGEINLTTLAYAAEFIESRHRATMAVAEGTILKGEGSRVLEKEGLLISTLARLCAEQESPVVLKRDLHQRLRRHFTSVRDFDNCLNEAVEIGKLQVVKNFKKKNVKNTKPTLGIALADVLE